MNENKFRYADTLANKLILQKKKKNFFNILKRIVEYNSKISSLEKIYKNKVILKSYFSHYKK